MPFRSGSKNSPCSYMSLATCISRASLPDPASKQGISRSEKPKKKAISLKRKDVRLVEVVEDWREDTQYDYERYSPDPRPIR